VTTRRSTSNTRRDSPKSSPGRGGSLLTGLFIGLIVGLVLAAGLAWYLTNRTPNFKTTEVITPTPPKIDKTDQVEPTTSSKKTEVEVTQTAPDPKPNPPRTSTPAPTPAPETAPKPRVDYTFYGILPGEKNTKQALPPPTPQPSKDIWWLQVAALKNPAEAEKLKARLSLLGLNVAMQKITSGTNELYRIRVGPYKREDDAFGDLDTLAENNFEPRLFKDPTPSPTPLHTSEKP
jgi:cell division protein FtsN